MKKTLVVQSPAHQLKAFRSFCKRQLKIKKMTYADLGKKLGVSEVTIKRWMSTADLSLTQLIAIGEVLDFQLFSFIQSDVQDHRRFGYYSEAQEAFLCENKLSFLVFIKLHFGVSLAEIQKITKTNDHQMLKILLSLEKAKLIEVWPDKRFRLKLKGPFMARVGGQIENELMPNFNDQVISHFRNHVKLRNKGPDPSRRSCTFYRPSELYLTRDSALQMSAEFSNLYFRYMQLSMDETEADEKVEPISVLLGVDTYDTWLNFLLKS